MLSPLVYYQLAVVGCLWLCLMLPYVWSSRGVISPKQPTEPGRCLTGVDVLCSLSGSAAEDSQRDRVAL
jgi:hypothetical protein